MLIPGVPGNGPASINGGVLAALWLGFRGGDKVFGEPVPVAEPGLEWHSVPIAEVQRLLPRPPDEHEQPAKSENILMVPIRLLDGAGRSAWSLLSDFSGEMRTNLSDPLTPILATGALGALLGSPLDAALVGGVLLTNAALSAERQVHAERVLRRLLAVQDPPPGAGGNRRRAAHSDCRRQGAASGRSHRGACGDVVPADGRLIEAGDLEVDESTLTGESPAVAQTVRRHAGCPLAERACMIYAGTTVVAGSGLAIVTAVEPVTEMHRAMAMAPRRSREIGLSRQLSRITRRALPWSLTGGGLVGLFSLMRGTPLRESVDSAVALTVAAVPEGLPLVATLAQLSAARRLTNESVLVRNANSVEALARLDAVCFDKTGTLSENRLQVKTVRPMTGYPRRKSSTPRFRLRIRATTIGSNTRPTTRSTAPQSRSRSLSAMRSCPSSRVVPLRPLSPAPG